MKESEAVDIVGYLNAAFPREALEPESFAVWAKDVALLAEASIGARAAEMIARSGDHFPTIHQFRLAYRSVLERTQQELPGLPEARGTKPEWVDVWLYARTLGLTDAYFPQMSREVAGREMPWLTMDEYEEIRKRWVQDGRPSSRDELDAVARTAELPRLSF